MPKLSARAGSDEPVSSAEQPAPGSSASDVGADPPDTSESGDTTGLRARAESADPNESSAAAETPGQTDPPSPGEPGPPQPPAAPPPPAAPEPPVPLAAPEPSAESDATGDSSVVDEQQASERAQPDWDGFPDVLRGRLAELAASALGEMKPLEIPRPLRPVAKFTPAKRARLGRAPLLAELRSSTAFRTAVLRWADRNRPAAVDVDAQDPIVRAVASVLAADESAAERVGAVSRQAEDSRLRAERDAALAQVQRLTEELEQLRSENGAVRAAVEQARAESEEDLEKLRRRLREQGVRVRDAKDASAAAIAELEQIRAASSEAVRELTLQRDRERDRADAERARAKRAMADAESARQSAREARQADEVRLSLLVDTLDGAVLGLRRELAIGGGGGPRPADLVGGASTGQVMAGRVEDPAALDRLLALPTVHLVVDGYNVTKTGYPELTLASQRERLAAQLGALAARTGAEVTVVFDGADVVSVPAVVSRGTRVLFSDPGVLADDVIRALVAAEPEGRPVVVATSDRAVADSVRRRGAHPVPSVILLARLSRI
ncbi:NYN domain-containing protein [Actinoalloteichus hymeniacidonis]|uniref:YacP-like NYN domain n=1 Tax=Actinoalloteichus hymeniacidonis TaxID=340345 RepID=A0AAC9HTD8_9PSEU|nr:NYN domain-containing protein [Actinoalloteichus hymeniacidonis]AOS65133.1 YacP-like NYN domain [Actinoalloteichus hymeniacidonis]MBB5906788.1 putative RNA-binding protein with PIN domain [Actinoalloteichus hymeniacidonis]